MLESQFDAQDSPLAGTEKLKREDNLQWWFPLSWWRRLNLRSKATVIALTVGVIPIAVVGRIAYGLSSSSMRRQIITQQEERAFDLRQEVEFFLQQIIDDTKTIANSPIITDPQLQKKISKVQKINWLNGFIESKKNKYESIVIFDRNGNLMFQSESLKPFATNKNYRDRDYFQKAIATGTVVISEPQVEPNLLNTELEIAAPIKEPGTQRIIGVARLGMDLENLSKVFDHIEIQGWEYKIIAESSNKVVMTDEKEFIGQASDIELPGLKKLQEQVWRKIDSSQVSIDLTQEPIASGVMRDKNDEEKVLVSFITIRDLEGLTKPGWGLAISRPVAEAFEPLIELRWALILGTIAAAIAVGAIATIIINQATRPISAAARAVERIGQGKLDTRLEVKGRDELAILGFNINEMAQRLKSLLAEKALSATEQKQAKEQMQQRAMELLTEVQPVSEGDLTIRATITHDEIGTVADSYNAMIESLRLIVTEVKTATQEVLANIDNNENSVNLLSSGATQQSREIANALNRTQAMAASIRAVATNAEKAEMAVQEANQMVEAGDNIMNLTVEGIGEIQQTVAETSEKVKYLGESSQKISKVVNLITNFAAQTNLLALNASIEAARAGEEGRGFAVVADEIRTLAQQSTEAAAEIEKLVASIQLNTKELVTAMETGTERVVTGTKLVNETRQSLNQITTASTQIYSLVKKITRAAIEQSQDSQAITQTMTEVSGIAQKTSVSASELSVSFQELLGVTQKLQKKVEQFKVN